MIFLPAIGAAVAAVAPVVKAAIVAAGIGAAIGGAACGVGGAIGGFQEQGSLNKEIAVSAVHRAGECAVEGAVVGGATGGVGLVIAPAFAPAVGSALTVVDDIARPVIQVADDIARPAIQAVDDSVRPPMRHAHNFVAAPFRLFKSLKNARNYLNLPKGSGEQGYVYVMDDVATPGRYKIGKTIQPDKRLKQVQSDLNKSSVSGKVEYACIISTDNMSILETTLKQQFKSQNLRRFPAGTEWFSLSAAQVAAACSR